MTVAGRGRENRRHYVLRRAAARFTPGNSRRYPEIALRLWRLR